MEEKFAEHREVIESRLDAQDTKLDEMKSDLTALVGSDKVPGQVTRLTDLVEGLVTNHTTWHDADIEFRTDITSKVTKLGEQQDSLAKDVKQVKWVVKTSYVIAKLSRITIRVVRESKSFYKLFFACGLSWVVVVQFFHAVFPHLRHWLATGKW